MADNRCIDFFLGLGKTDHGRMLDDLIQASDDRLELDHQYIQWLFPNRSHSRVNWHAPVLDDETLAALKASPEAIANFRRGLDRMIRFYEGTDHWLVPEDHNHLRITRIIEAVGLILSVHEARDFHDRVLRRVQEAGDPVSARAQKHWQSRLAAISQVPTGSGDAS